VRESGRGHRPTRPIYREALQPHSERTRILSYIPYVFGGMMLVAAFAFAGHYMGQNAVARGLPADEQLADVVSPATTIIAKGSLLPSDASLDLASLPIAREQEVMSLSKGDYVNPDPGTAADTVVKPKPLELRLAMTPPVWKLESTFMMKRSEKQKIIAQRRTRLAEEDCLAKAVYFEARTESELGQLAVAKVILNRVKDPGYPKTICGVVYQGSDHRNSCQFSFACDGLPDDVTNQTAWAESKHVAQKALAGDETLRIMSAATHYHADYVRPRWSYQMKRLIKIGRHIFYADS
jgi:spore germination cell wall hydrolase CwlJ-like protein